MYSPLDNCTCLGEGEGGGGLQSLEPSPSPPIITSILLVSEDEIMMMKIISVFLISKNSCFEYRFGI